MPKHYLLMCHIIVCVVGLQFIKFAVEKRKNSVRIVVGINGGMPIWIRLIVKHSIPLCAVIAKSRLVLMVTKIGSIAHMSAISLTDLEVLHMSDEQMKNEMLYQGTMSIAKNLLKQGTISEEEYRQIDTMFKQKYAVSLSTLFTDIRLIKFADHGNM